MLWFQMLHLVSREDQDEQQETNNAMLHALMVRCTYMPRDGLCDAAELTSDLIPTTISADTTWVLDGFEKTVSARMLQVFAWAGSSS